MIKNRRITFETFMRKALHDPQNGYYARNIRAVGGGRADFTTVPMQFGDLLARAIAKWAAEAMRNSACHNLIEIGPGEGSLMREVIRHLPWHVRWRVRLHLVETSDVLETRQRTVMGNRAVWYRTPQDAMRACKGRAVIFSNELVDAFPVRLFQKTGDGWSEVCVEIDAHGRVCREVLNDATDLPDSSIFEIPHAEKQRVEVHDAYRIWLAEWLPHWKAGELLTIDYGDVAEKLYHRRPSGTLRGYLMHQRITGAEIYQNIGMQDLTADVNFTDLARWAHPWCESQELQSLAAFLRSKLGEGSSRRRWADNDGTNLGLEGSVGVSPAAEPKTSGRDARAPLPTPKPGKLVGSGCEMTDDQMAGGAFRVLCQQPLE